MPEPSGTHLIDIWREQENIDPASGKVLSPTWTKVTSLAKGDSQPVQAQERMMSGVNLSSKGRKLYLTGRVTEVLDTDLIVTRVNSKGTPTGNPSYYRVEGAPEDHYGTTATRIDHWKIYLDEHLSPPDEITSTY